MPGGVMPGRFAADRVGVTSSRLGVLLGALALALAAAGPAAAGPVDRAAQTAGTKGLWHGLSTAAARAELRGASIRPDRFRPFELDREGLAGALDRRSLVLEVPAPGGGFQRFALEEAPVLAPELAAQHPEIETYSGRGIDDPAATIHADLTPLGFHASVRSPQGAWYVDPADHRDADGLYVSYFARDLENVRAPLVEPEGIEEVARELASAVEAGPAVTRRVYRLALVSDPSYATYFGAANVTAAKTTLVSRVSQIYETESAIRLVLAPGNDVLNLNTNAQATGPNGPCGAEPCYFAGELAACGPDTLHWTRIVIGQLLGASNYDVGHIVLGVDGGGIAGLGVVGESGKANGCTALPQPVGDFFAVDYVAHELGHQFGANHTFNGTGGSCSGGNRSAPNSVEPGSGSSIMAYAGICGSDNLQPHTDAYWSQRSRQEIASVVGVAGGSISEVQTVSLTGFGPGDSFRLQYDGHNSPLIQSGSNYTPAGIRTAIHGISGFPTTVSVEGFGGGGLTSTGFEVTFNGVVNRLPFSLVNLSGVTGFVGETDKGGAVTNGGTVEATGNNAPDVGAPASFTIPVRTPFALTASGSDPDGDTVTYLWEQNNTGTGSGTALFTNAKANGPLFRVFGTPLQKPPYVPTQYNNALGVNAPTTSPTRVFPDLAQILAGNTNAVTGSCPPLDVECFSEFLPLSTYAGPLSFRVTARDNRADGGGVATADTTLTLAPAAGPFRVTSHGDGTPLTGGGDEPVTWNVAGTAASPVSAANVRISLSVDGGLTYPHELATATANDGSETVVIPNIAAAAARIKVEAVGNVFFDLNDASFEIEAGTGAPNTSILSGPAGPTNDSTSAFAFTSSEPGATFECRVDTDPFDDCTSPHTTDALADGLHTFEVQATAGGETDPTPAARTFTVDTLAPDAPGLAGPSGLTGDSTPTFTMSSGPGESLECRLDGAAFAGCASPKTVGPVAAGPHTFEARTADAAGNVGAVSSGSFTYVLPPTTKMGARTIRSAARTATFRFTGAGGIGARTFRCRLTGAKTTAAQRAWSKCAAPKTYRRLKLGSYTFYVRARDATGRVDATPAKSAFRIRSV
jgi:Metallo-peptidase family M12B Reprolysin-like